MPVFAFISGMFFDPSKEFIPTISRKFKQLIIPIITWVTLLTITIFLKNTIKEIVTKSPHMDYNVYITYYLNKILYDGWWFLRALFICFAYGLVTHKIYSKKITIWGLFSVLALYFLSFLGVIPNHDRFLLGFIYLYPFFSGGFLFNKYKSHINRYSTYILLVSLIIIVAGFATWKGYDDSFYPMNTSIFEETGNANITGLLVIWKTIYRFCIGLAACLSLTMLYEYLSVRIPSCKSPVLLYVFNISKNTLSIYIVHMYLLESFVSQDFFNKYTWGQSFLFAILVSCIMICLSEYLVSITHKKTCQLILWGKC